MNHSQAIIFIDAGLSDLDVLLSGLPNDHGASGATPENESHLAPDRFPSPQPPPGGRGSKRALRDFHSKDMEHQLIDPSRNGLDQIAQALSKRHDIPALHLITHGMPGNCRPSATP
jgi:hypothetical protein